MTEGFRRYRRAAGHLVAVLALFCALVVLHGQQPPTSDPQQPPPTPTPQQRPTFRGGANLVRVDVTVIDHHGEQVTNLTKDDFEVREDGVLQTVETFKLVEANGEPAADDDVSLAIRSPEHAAAEAARDDVRVFVIFWDEYHIGQLVPANLAREALTSFVRSGFGPTDLVAIMDPLTPLDAIRFTRDRMALADQAHQLKGRLGVYVPARSAMEEAQLYMARDVEAIRAQVTASALEAAILYLRSIRDGRKAILFVSQDIGPIGGRGPGTASERYRWLDKAIRLANDSNTAIYTMDPRGFTGNLSDVLRALASETGGKAFQNNAPAAALRQIVKDASAFYLLGYPSQGPADGKFHRIKVHVKRPDLDVRARNGYLAPSLAELEAAKKAVIAAEVPADITNALSPLRSRPESAGDLWVGMSRGPDSQPRVTVSWQPRALANESKKQQSTRIAIKATSADRGVQFDGELQGGSASFTAPPGALTIRRTLIDPDGAAGEREDIQITVPDFERAALSISTPIVLRARTGLDLNAMRAARDVTPYAAHEFDRTDRMLVRFSLFGKSASDATVTANLLSRSGVALSALTFRPAAGQDGTYDIELPMASVARGEYLIAVDASHGDERVRALVPFRVL